MRMTERGRVERELNRITWDEQSREEVVSELESEKDRRESIENLIANLTHLEDADEEERG